MKKYNRISEEERNEIVVLLNKGLGINKIAQKLGRNKGAISREIKRNHGRKMYRAHKAQERAEIRQKESHRKFVLKSHALRKEVEKRISDDRWSPEIISGRLKYEGKLPSISPESIYRWIFNYKQHLIGYLTRYSKNKHYKRGRKPKNDERIKERIYITQRPESINNRSEFGHWETDLMEGLGQSCLKVSVERKGRFSKLRKVKNKTSSESTKALIDMFSLMPKASVKSITYDNGTENTGHIEVNKFLGTKSYFCQPYHSWEKGTVENTNGIIRRFFPKNTNFDIIADYQIQQLELWLNNRPRKCLNYLTPTEVFNSTVALAT